MTVCKTNGSEKEIARLGLKLELQNGKTHRIGDWSSLPRCVAQCLTTPPLNLRPSYSGAPSTSRYFISVSVSVSVSLSLYLKNESEMKLWNESLSLFKTLSDSLFLNVIVCCFCLALFITLLIFAPVFGFICWCWWWCWWDTLNCLLVLVLVSFGENREIQLIGFIWLALVLWWGVVGHWGLSMDRGMGPGKMHMGCVAVC